MAVIQCATMAADHVIEFQAEVEAHVLKLLLGFGNKKRKQIYLKLYVLPRVLNRRSRWMGTTGICCVKPHGNRQNNRNNVSSKNMCMTDGHTALLLAENVTRACLQVGKE